MKLVPVTHVRRLLEHLDATAQLSAMDDAGRLAAVRELLRLALNEDRALALGSDPERRLEKVYAALHFGAEAEEIAPRIWLSDQVWYRLHVEDEEILGYEVYDHGPPTAVLALHAEAELYRAVTLDEWATPTAKAVAARKLATVERALANYPEPA